MKAWQLFMLAAISYVAPHMPLSVALFCGVGSLIAMICAGLKDR